MTERRYPFFVGKDEPTPRNFLEDAKKMGLLPPNATHGDLTTDIRQAVLDTDKVKEAINMGLLPPNATHRDITLEIRLAIHDNVQLAHAISMGLLPANATYRDLTNEIRQKMVDGGYDFNSKNGVHT